MNSDSEGADRSNDRSCAGVYLMHKSLSASRLPASSTRLASPLAMRADAAAGLAVMPGGVVRSRQDQPGLVDEDDGLDPVADTELAQQARDVAFDGGLADEEPAGELGVGQAAGEQPQDLGFPAGQCRQRGRGFDLLVWLRSGESAEEAPGD